MKERFDKSMANRFAPTSIDDVRIKRLLKQGLDALSADSQRAWEFIVLTKPELKSCVSEFFPNEQYIADAVIQIILIADTNQLDINKLDRFDIEAAIKDILKEATRLGLDGVSHMIAPYDDRMELTRRLFHLPGRFLPLAVISVGYPMTEDMQQYDKFDWKRVHFNRYRTGER